MYIYVYRYTYVYIYVYIVVAGSSRARHNLKIVVFASTAALARLALPSFLSGFLCSSKHEQQGLRACLWVHELARAEMLRLALLA